MSNCRKKAVGRSSSRTPFKHWILNAELGRLCGIFSRPQTAAKVPARANPFLVVDLCAGDGEVSGGMNSSPAIIAHHLGWAEAHGVRVQGVLIEKVVGTFEMLVKNIPARPWLEFIHGDALDFVAKCRPMQGVFIHSDPNHIHDWPISEALLEGLSETTTMLCTLGCNVGGLKMLPREDRAKWYDRVAACIKGMPRYHDAVLVTLEGDAAQWAYLLRLPAKWTEDTCRNIVTVGSRYTDFGLNLASYRNSRDQFRAMEDRLFLTAKERCAT